jgi:glutamyl-tRNA reductase
LADETPRSVTVASRRYDRASALAERYGALATPWEELPAQLATADVVFGCTSAPEPVLRAGELATARADSARPLLCLDLGVPRDIDPDVRRLPGVRLVDMDELQAAAAENRTRRAQEVEHAEAVVAGEVERLMEWWRSRQVVPTIAALRAYAAEVRDAEVEHALARMGDVSPRDAFIVRALAQRIVGKLLHRPLTVLKADAEGANMAQVLRQLFQLEPIAEAESGACPAPGSDEAAGAREADGLEESTAT